MFVSAFKGLWNVIFKHRGKMLLTQASNSMMLTKYTLNFVTLNKYICMFNC